MPCPFFTKLSLSVFAVGCVLAGSGDASAAGRSLSGVIVATDKTGDFPTVQQAINAAPDGGTQPFVIHLKPGRYHEKLVIPKTKGPLQLCGDDAATTVLAFDDHADTLGVDGQKLGTVRSASTTALANYFSAEGITFENAFGPGSQAVALNVFCEHAQFRRCRFIGWQDTLLLKGGTQYFEDCRMVGSVDFIFGAATAFFERCELHCLTTGAITAASTPEDHPHGFVFDHCKITTEPGLWKTYFGRPWRPFASVVFLSTEVSDSLAPVGWLEWINAPERNKTARYAEYHSTGPGADASARAAWSRQLGDAEARELMPGKVLGWNPELDSIVGGAGVVPGSARLASGPAFAGRIP